MEEQQTGCLVLNAAHWSQISLQAFNNRASFQPGSCSSPWCTACCFAPSLQVKHVSKAAARKCTVHHTLSLTQARARAHTHTGMHSLAVDQTTWVLRGRHEPFYPAPSSPRILWELWFRSIHPQRSIRDKTAVQDPHLYTRQKTNVGNCLFLSLFLGCVNMCRNKVHNWLPQSHKYTNPWALITAGQQKTH